MDTKTYLAARNASKGSVTIYAEYSHNRKLKRVPTGIRVAQANWDNTTRKVISTGATAANKKTQEVLELLKNQVRELYLANGNVSPTVEQLSRHQLQRAEVVQAVATEIPLTQVLTEWMETKEDWAPSTRRNFYTLLYNIQDFEEAHKTTWYLSALQTSDVRVWQQWLKKAKQGKEQLGYNDATLHKRIRLLRQFLRQHPAPGVKLTDDGTKALHAVMQTTPFVLSQEMLDAIESLVLPPLSRLDRLRDVLVLQAFCGLRWSDMSRLETRYVAGDFISLPMKKSAAKAVKVHVPLFRQARQVLAKYTNDGKLNLPTFAEQEFNRGIKDVCQLVEALHEEHTQDYRLHGKPMERTKPKWKFVTSHTLRRSFVSLCLDKNFAVKEVMSWSGHSSLAAFQRYIGSTAQRVGSIAEFDQRWEANRASPRTTPAPSEPMTMDSLLNGIGGLPISDELKRVLAQYATSMPPQRTPTDSNVYANVNRQ